MTDRTSRPGTLQCPICENSCLIAPGRQGRCGRYENRQGRVVEAHPHRYLMACPIRIETMPILHFHPGARFLQVSTVGCNFNCPGCISAVIVREMDPQSQALRHHTPEEIVTMAEREGCRGIAFLMNDPLAAFDTFMEVATLAKSKGLLVGCSSNGYFSEQSIRRLIPVLDFINVGVKGLSDDVYHGCGGFRGASPVLRNLKLLHRAGVHVEVACIHTRQNAGELLTLCTLLHGMSPQIPLQVMRFIPLEGSDPRLEPLIRETEELAEKMRSILDHVYVFNAPGTLDLNTRCPQCGKTLLQRDFYGPMGARLTAIAANTNGEGMCPECGRPTGIDGGATLSDFREKDFQGGYPFTRALEIVESILIAMGADSKAEIVRVWDHLLCNGGMGNLHHDIQRIDSYLELIRSFGRLIGRQAAADELADYLADKTNSVREACQGSKHRPRVYYAMGKPRFCLKGQRFENHLVETCFGHSVNRELDVHGRPGMSISPDELTRLNPEVILISSFLSNSPTDFMEQCRRDGIVVDAVRNGRVHTPAIPSSDFGSPRWILGLMFVANVMYPERVAFDITAEAEEFHSRFHGGRFDPDAVNRSFGKPSSAWKWNETGGSATQGTLSAP
ncbi:MAG: radical SAM protein [Desulfovibrio sp.]|uniref:radical SAM protein n=1 Tax=Desulfovibrio sp. 7SRBS1 TaxID=3378064 RepID=UPI003B3E7EE6